MPPRRHRTDDRDARAPLDHLERELTGASFEQAKAAVTVL
jgi:hypothetical protein